MSAQKGTASTRLLSMKFMQRAAAREPNNETPSTPAGPPAKRMRLANGTSMPISPKLSDKQRLQHAQAEEDAQRSAVMERLAAEAGETRWVLNVKEPPVTSVPVTFVQAGFVDLDAPGDHEQAHNSDEEEEESARPLVAGRMVFSQMKQAVQPPAAEEDVQSDSGASDDEDDKSGESEHEQDSTYQAHRDAAAAKKHANMRAKKQELERLAALRRAKEINLNRPQSDGEVNLSKLKTISGGAAAARKGGSHYRPGGSRKR